MNETPILALEGISYAYPGAAQPALNGADLALRAGRMAMVGPNGSGKTTLLHVLMGLVTPQTGRVLFKGEEVRGEAGFRALRRKVGFVFQQADDQLFSPTVLEDVAFGPLNLGKSPAEARRAAEKALADLGLAGFEERVTHKLSGGEKRMVALATVLAMEPEVLILDEPTNDLDPDTRHRLIHTLCALPQAMLVVSHDWDFLDHIVDTVCSVADGTVSMEEKPVLHVHKHAHAGGGAHHHHG